LAEPEIPRRIVIIAALEREVPVLVKLWRRVERQHEGQQFTFFEGPLAVLICGGIGAERARRATEAAIAIYRCPLVISAGFAGALGPGVKVGQTIFPTTVIDAKDSSRWESVVKDTKVGQTDMGKGVLVSFSSVADREQKGKLAREYGAQIVDMEAAAVAKGAEARGVPFLAAKAISDDYDLNLPPMNKFVRNGQFNTLGFVLYVSPRPWLWRAVIRLARNSRAAARNLCLWLGNDVLWTTATLRLFTPQEQARQEQ